MLTVPQAAKELGVTQGSVRIAIYEGRLPSVEMYDRKLIAQADLDAYKKRSQPDGVKKVGRPRKAQETQAE
ncbi:MAG: helix-turn-helix domain-containing protein [Janthinobacterium lividum]